MKYSLSLIFSFFLIQFCSAQSFDSLIPLDRPVGFIYDLTTLDIDNDGDKDFIFCEQTELYWMENLGDNQIGELQGPIYEADGYINFLFTNDLDQDGDDDLQMGIGQGNAPIAMDNLDNGLLGAPQELNPPINIYNIILSDPKLDGTRDLMTAGFSNVYRAIGNPDGTYAPTEYLFPTQGVNRGMALKDLDGDGINDLILHSYTSVSQNEFVWYPGESNGEFADAISIGSATIGYMAVADIDQDGDNDIIRAGSNGVDWFVNDGNGYFINTTINNLFSDFATSNNSLPISDMDQDGDLDICLQTYDDKVVWLENNGSSENWPIREINTPWTENLKVSDINGDGFDDVITYLPSGSGQSRITYSLNDGNGIFQEHWDAGFTAILVYTQSIDINGDGLDDLVGSDIYADGVYLYINAGNGMFKTQKTLYLKTSNLDSNSPDLRHVTDIDGDGDYDVVFELEYGTFGWMENLGEDKFDFRGMMETPLLNTYYKTHFGDFNGDDLPDLLTTDSDEGLAELHLATEPGVYVYDQNIADTYGTFNGLRVADFDNDSDIDLIFFPGYGQETRLYINDGLGNFTADIEPITSTNYWRLEFDVDSDGDLDGFDNDRWFENDSTNKFSEIHYLANVGDNGESFRGLYDFEGDLDQDRLINGARIQLNLGYGAFMDPISLVNEELIDISEAVLVDCDSDGDLDVLGWAGSDTPNGEHRLYLSKNLGFGGCTDVSACNYNPDANLDDGSCCYTNCGCTNPNAENTDVSASCDDGSCSYEITGYVFRDIDDSGALTASDIGMAFERVLLMPDSMIFTTDEFGQFHVAFQGDEPRVLSVMKRPARDLMTTESGYNINVNDPSWTNPIYEFGFTELLSFNEWRVVHSLKAAIESPGRHYSCNEEVIHEFYITNDGSSTLDAIINVSIGSDFVGYQEIDDLTSLSATEFQFTANLLEPGERRVFQIGLLTPEANGLIEELEVTGEVIGYYEGEVEVQKSIFKSELFNCNPENNIISSEPKGYTAEHYIVGDETIRYNLEFQNNTSNNVSEVIINNLFSDDMQIQNLQIIDAQGLSYCTINLVEKTMIYKKQNANLAPSSENYNNSYGHLIFDLKLKPGLTPGTVIDISNDIVFDGELESIGSYFHTIVDCNVYTLAIEPSALDLCFGEEVFVEANGDLFENIEWSIGGESLGNDGSINFSSLVPVEDTLFLTSENQVCSNSTSIPVTVTQTLFAEVEGNMVFCEGDSTTINSLSPVNHEWIFNDELIGTESAVTLYESGDLQLTLNDGQCVSIPITVEIESVNNPGTPYIIISGDNLITSQISGHTYQWYFEGEIIPGATSTSFYPELSGTYMVEAINTTGCSTISAEEVVSINISVNEIENDLFTLYPNPMSDYTILEFGNLKKVSNIYLSDSNGRIVRIDALNNNQSNHRIKKGDLMAGIYFISFVIDGQVYKKQLIIL